MLISIRDLLAQSHGNDVERRNDDSTSEQAICNVMRSPLSLALSHLYEKVTNDVNIWHSKLNRYIVPIK